MLMTNGSQLNRPEQGPQGPANHRLWTVLTLLLAILAPFGVQAKETRTVQILYLGESEGDFIPFQCERSRTRPVNWSNLLATLEPMLGSDTLVLSSGSLLGGGASGLFLLEQGDAGTSIVGNLVRGTGLVLATPGVSEFGLPYRRFLEFVAEYQQAGIPYGVANLECPDDDPACRSLALPKGTVVTVSGLRVGLIPVLSPSVAMVVPPDNTRGLQITDPAAAASEIARQWREASAVDLVVALTHLESVAGGANETLEFSRNVTGVDVVVAGGLAEPRGEDPVITRAMIRDKGPLLVGTPRSPRSFGRLTLKLTQNGPDWSIADYETSLTRVTGLKELREASNMLAQAVADYCVLAMRVLGEGRIEPPMGRGAFVSYVLEILRRQTRSHLSLLSLDSIRLGPDEELSGPISSGLLSRAFERHQVVVLSVLGKDLEAFLKLLLQRPGQDVVLSGAKLTPDGTVQVNERNINPNLKYRVATSGFLASGAKGVMTSLVRQPQTSRKDTGYFLQEMVQLWFQRGRFAPGSEPEPILQQKDFSDLYALPLWESALVLNMGLSSIQIDNGSSYAESQLSRSPFLGFNGDGRLTLSMSTRDHMATDFTRLQYAMTRTGDQDLRETQDQVTQELAYSWTRVRNVWGKGKAYVPVPVVRGKMETEFTQAEESDYRHLELTGTTGIQWVFARLASAGLTYGLRKELLDPGDSVHYGLQLYYDIASLPLLTWNQVNNLKLDSRFELFYSDWRTDQVMKGAGSSRLSLAVGGGLAVTFGLDFFLFTEKGQSLGYSVDTTVGISLSIDAAVQQFE